MCMHATLVQNNTPTHALVSQLQHAGASCLTRTCSQGILWATLRIATFSSHGCLIILILRLAWLLRKP